MPAGSGSRRTAGSIDERCQSQRLRDVDDHPFRSQEVGSDQADPVSVRSDSFVYVSVGREQLDKPSHDIRLAGGIAAKLQADALAIGAIDIQEAVNLFRDHCDHQGKEAKETLGSYHENAHTSAMFGPGENLKLIRNE